MKITIFESRGKLANNKPPDANEQFQFHFSLHLAQTENAIIRKRFAHRHFLRWKNR